MMAATEEPVSTEEPQARGIVDDVINAVSDAVDESKDVANDITGGAVGDIENAAHNVQNKLGAGLPSLSLPGSRKPGYWIAFMVIAAAVLIGASAQYAGENSSYGDYAVSVGAVGAGLGLLTLLVYRSRDSNLKKVQFELQGVGQVTNEMLIAFFFFVWWVVGACVLTFNFVPFAITGNGYFSLWAGAFASAGYLADASGRTLDSLASRARSKGPLFGLIVPSVVLIIATTTDNSFGQSRLDLDQCKYGLSVGIISLVGILFLLALDDRGSRLDFGRNGQRMADTLPKLVAFVLVCLWAAAAIVLTFDKPFTNTSLANGYFACWLGLILSFCFAVQEIEELRKIVDDATAASA